MTGIARPLRVFIGYDSREPVAYHVLAHSIIRRTSAPVIVTPIVLSHLSKIYTRKRDPLETSEFTLTRFLVPYLSRYDETSVFMDSDMLCLGDISELVALHERSKTAAVSVVKHDYVPTTAVKKGGQPQSAYPRKNWSSLMVFDNWACRLLTPEYVNGATPAQLHRFAWTNDENIGEIPREWNWLVGEYPENPHAKMLHYTLGGPWKYDDSAGPHAAEWFREFESMCWPSVVGMARKVAFRG